MYMAYAYRRNPIRHALAGRGIYTVWLTGDGGATYQGHGDTLDSAWHGALLSADILGGVRITADCPWPEPVSARDRTLHHVLAASRAVDRVVGGFLLGIVRRRGLSSTPQRYTEELPG